MKFKMDFMCYGDSEYNNETLAQRVTIRSKFPSVSIEDVVFYDD